LHGTNQRGKKKLQLLSQQKKKVVKKILKGGLFPYLKRTSHYCQEKKPVQWERKVEMKASPKDENHRESGGQGRGGWGTENTVRKTHLDPRGTAKGPKTELSDLENAPNPQIQGDKARGGPVPSVAPYIRGPRSPCLYDAGGNGGKKKPLMRVSGKKVASVEIEHNPWGGTRT